MLIILCLAFKESLSFFNPKIKSTTVWIELEWLNISPASPIASGIPKYAEPMGIHSQSIASHNELGSPSSLEPWK